MNLIKHSQSRVLNLPPSLFFHVVSDVESYPKFLPWCSESKIIKKNDRNFEVFMKANFKLYESSYISVVSIQKDEPKQEFLIRSESNDTSAFKKLISIWDIKNSNGITKYNYHIEFQFRNIFYQTISSFFLKEVVHTMSSAFEQRAFVIEKQKLSKNEPDIIKENNIEIVVQRLLSSQLITKLEYDLIVNLIKDEMTSKIIDQGFYLYYGNTTPQNSQDIKFANFLSHLLLEKKIN